jgi:hypothetical protein
MSYGIANTVRALGIRTFLQGAEPARDVYRAPGEVGLRLPTNQVSIMPRVLSGLGYVDPALKTVQNGQNMICESAAPPDGEGWVWVPTPTVADPCAGFWQQGGDYRPPSDIVEIPGPIPPGPADTPPAGGDGRIFFSDPNPIIGPSSPLDSSAPTGGQYLLPSPLPQPVLASPPIATPPVPSVASALAAPAIQVHYDPNTGQWSVGASSPGSTSATDWLHNIGVWLQESTIIQGWPNWIFAGGGGLLLWGFVRRGR